MGTLIVIEGSDGSGKATQTKLLYEYLKDQGKKVKMVSYPNYESPSSSLVKMYLGGRFGTDPYGVNAYVASSFFAVDRFASYLGEWKEFYESSEDAVVICDRYVTSNMLHQTSKLTSMEEKERFLDWDYDFEFQKGGLPVPDVVFFLDVDPKTAFLLMKDRENKFTHESEKDIHETNARFLTQSYENSMFVGEKYNWTKIRCCQCPGKMRKIEEIHEEIREKLNKMLFTDKVI
ncbi:MAG: deoxynucleoside kinase [Hungatella sp.]|nr:deoxynucleoside kinase [Hungatella sp.]